MSTKLISVIIITFNQDRFISRALDSVISQKNIENIEIIIGNDCSDDSTDLILSNYKKKYSSLINIISRRQNLGPSKNLHDLICIANGEYIAILEGDDYWTDPFKLSKQIKFLNDNRSHVACTHRYSLVDEHNNIIQSEYYGPGKPDTGVYTLKHFENYTYFSHLGSLVFRNVFKSNDVDLSIIKNAHYYIADITINMLLCFFGKIEILDDNMLATTFLIKKNGTNYKSSIKKYNQIMSRIIYLDTLKDFAKNFFHYDLKFKNRNEYYVAWSILYLLRYPNKHNLKVLLFTYNRNKNKFILFLYLMRNSHKLIGIILKKLLAR